jgi:hypothetical protein
LPLGGPLRKFIPPPYFFPEGGVEVPQDLKDGFFALRDGFLAKLGIDSFIGMLKPVPGKMDKLCFTIPFKQLADCVEWGSVERPSGFEDKEVCIDFDELAQEGWVSPLRNALLFMVVCMFMSVVVVVLRQY